MRDEKLSDAPLNRKREYVIKRAILFFRATLSWRSRAIVDNIDIDIEMANGAHIRHWCRAIFHSVWFFLANQFFLYVRMSKMSVWVSLFQFDIEQMDLRFAIR